MNSKIISFYRTLLTNPREVGAALPSSKQLAKTMANYIPLKKNHLVIELGPGTGVITKAILHRGIKSENLIMIEQSKYLAKSLSQQFPQIKVILGSATQLEELLKELDKPISAIISSLPLLSLSVFNKKIILNKIEKILSPDGYFIQYTYGNRDPCSNYFSKLKKIDSKKIWKNFPPARVFVYSKKL